MNDMTNTAVATKDADFSMNGLAYVAMPLGAIRIGHCITTAGQIPVPVRDDEFKVTQPLRDMDGNWLLDPLDQTLRSASQADGQEPSSAQRKLREIPIRIHVNDPSLVVRSRLEAFDVVTRRTVCASKGDGQAKRWTGTQGTVDVACEGCDNCSFALSGQVSCKFFGRIAVQIQGQKSELGTYVMRTSSYNTLKSFETQLWQFWSVLGRNLRGVPFVMRLRPAQTELSQWQTCYFVELDLDGVPLGEAVRMARAQSHADMELNVAALEQTIHAGIRNGGYLADAAEDGVDLNEFIRADRFAATSATDTLSGAVSSEPAAQTTTQVLLRRTLQVVPTPTNEIATPDGAGEVAKVLPDAGAGGIFLDDFAPRITPKATKATEPPTAIAVVPMQRPKATAPAPLAAVPARRPHEAGMSDFLN